MKVWLIQDFSHGETTVYAEGTDIAEIPYVAEELEYLVGCYDDEREEFINDLNRAVARGRGSATIEESLSAELVEVKEL